MSEQLLRDALAERDRLLAQNSTNDRFSAIENAFSVFKTKIDLILVTRDDIETAKKEVLAEMEKTISHVCAHFDKSLEDKTSEIKRDLIEELRRENRKSRRVSIRTRRLSLEGQERARRRIIQYGMVFAALLTALVTALTSGGGETIGRWVGVAKAAASLP